MSLVVHYKLNGDATDASGSGIDGTPTAISYDVGKVGQGAVFNGTTSRIAIALAMASGSRSFSIWCYTTDNTSAARYFFDSQTGRAIFAWRSANTTTKIGYYDNGTWRDFGNTPTDSAWHHVAFVCNATAGTVTCYLDGVQLGSALVYASVAIGGTTAIGGRYTLDTNTFNGTLDDLRIANEVWTISQIKAIYNLGVGSERYDPWRKMFGGQGRIRRAA